MIVVKKLTKKIITKTIKTDAEGKKYWLKLCQFADELDISILNKLKTESWEEFNEY